MSSNRSSDATAAERDADRSILNRLQDEIEHLPSALARIAKYIVENPEKVLRQSVSQLGEYSGSGEASILRLCRQIGFTGFRDFKLALAAEVGRTGVRHNMFVRSEASIETLEQALVQNLAMARSHCDPETLDAVASVLATSRRIDLFGAGMSGIVAEMFGFRFLRAGLTALVFRNTNMAHEVANGLGPGCVAIGISISGLTMDTVKFLKGAHDAGATTVAVTNRSRSPLGDIADFRLQAAGLDDYPIGDTLTATVGKIFVLECLMLSLARHMPATPSMEQNSITSSS